MAQPPGEKKKQWYEKISRSGYFFGALLLHLIVFIMVATWVIFPAFHPPQDDFAKTYVPPSTPPPPPPQPQESMPVSTQTLATPTTITSQNPTASFSVPLPNITPATTPVDVQQKMTQKVVSKPNSISDVRLASIMKTESNWGRTRENIENSGGDPRNVTAKFPVYLASYADGDWGCNVLFDGAGKINAGSLPNLVAKMNEWSHGHITGDVVPTPLDIGGPDLLAKTPPFIFFTGHKDFVLKDQEIQNLRDYLQVGGAIWGDTALPGRGSRFDVAFRREMKRVVPDIDKNFQPVDAKDEVFTKSWYPITKIPEGMNYYSEPLEHLDIDGKLAIFYTPNDYSDMFCMRIMPDDQTMGPLFYLPSSKSPLVTSPLFWYNSSVFFRNFQLPSCLACDKLGMNVIGYLLVRFDKELLLAP